MRKLTALGVLAANLTLSPGCKTTGKSDGSDFKIANGAPADSNQIVTKSTVALLIGGQQFCTGTLMDSNMAIVISAAHCFDGMYEQLKTKGLTIGFGTGPLFLDQRPVVTAIEHGGYSLVSFTTEISEQWEQSHPLEVAQFASLQAKQQAGTITAPEQAAMQQLLMNISAQLEPSIANPSRPINDIAILKFSGGIPGGVNSDGTPTYKDVDMALEPTLPQWFLAAGFGHNRDQSDAHGQLFYGWMKSNGATSASQEIVTSPSPQTNNTGTCHGDSGGPLYIYDWNQGVQPGQQGFRWPTVVGALSRATKLTKETCGGNVRSVYTDLRPKFGWIGCQVQRLNTNSVQPGCEVYPAIEMPFSSQGTIRFFNTPAQQAPVGLNLAERLELLSYDLASDENPQAASASKDVILGKNVLSKYEELRQKHLKARLKASPAQEDKK